MTVAPNGKLDALSRKNRSNDICLVIAFVMFLALKFLVPPVKGLTPAGVNMLAVFLPVVFLWIFVDTGWTSLLALVVLVGLDVIPITTALMTGFGTSTTWLTIAFIFCSAALKESGILDKVAYWLVSRKLTDGKPYTFLFIFLAGMMAIGIWMSHAVTILLFSTIGAAVCESVNVKKGEKMYTAVLMSVLWVCITAEAVIPYGKITGMTTIAVMEGFGIGFELPRYLKMSIPFAILYVCLAWLTIRFVLKPDVTKFKSYNGEEFRQKLKEMPFTKHQKITLAIYLLVVLSLLIPSMTFMPNLSAFFTRMGAAWMPIICMILLVVIRIDKKPILPLGKGMAQTPWEVMCFMAASLVFASQISKPEFGVTTLISNVLSDAIANAGAGGLHLVVIAAVGVALVATNFVSNTVVAAVGTAAFVPVLWAAYTEGTFFLHPWAVAGMIIMMVNISYLTPPASAMVPFILGPHVEIKDATKSSLALIGITFVLAVGIVYLIGY